MLSDLFSHSDQMLRHIVQHASAETVRAKLNAVADRMGEADFRARVARETVKRPRPQAAIAETVAKDRSLVGDALELPASKGEQRS